MNFLNEVTTRFPEAISFAPGRPYDGFFDIEEIFANIRRYLDHLAEAGPVAGADPHRDVPVRDRPPARSAS